MAGPWRRAAGVGLLLMVGVVSATPAEGTLRVDGALGLDGTTWLSPRGGALHAQPGSILEFEASGAVVNVTRASLTKVLANNPSGGGDFAVKPEAQVEYAEFSAAHVRIVGMQARATALAHAEAFDRPVEVSLESPTLRGVTDYVVIPSLQGGRSVSNHPSNPAEFRYLVRNAFETLSPFGGALALNGTTQIYLSGYEIEIASGDGRSTFRSGSSAVREVDVPGVGVVAREQEDSILLLRIADGTGAFAVTGATAWYDADPVLHVEGALTAAAAKGDLRLDGAVYPVRGEGVLVRGALTLEPARTSEGEYPVWDPDGYSPVYDPHFDAAISGDVTYVSVRAADRAYSDPRAQAVAATGIAGAIAVVYFWPLLRYGLTVALLPLYTRLREPELLENEVRNQIYEIIRENPGISARSVHRQSGQSWGTVVYHLRQLEKHHLVKSKRFGRSRNFYENHGKYNGMEVELAVLKGPRSLAVARTVLEQPGITQERLSEVAKLPQPTASYYVRKLKEAGLLLEQREGRYARYFPNGNLPRLYEIASRAPAEKAPPGELSANEEPAVP